MAEKLFPPGVCHVEHSWKPQTEKKKLFLIHIPENTIYRGIFASFVLVVSGRINSGKYIQVYGFGVWANLQGAEQFQCAVGQK